MAMRLSVLAGTLLLLATPLTAQEKAMQHASGTFEVTLTPEANAPAPAHGLPTARLALAKRFSGAIQGIAVGQMLSAGAPKPGQPAAYVAINQFDGQVDGRAGGFLLLHRGTMTRDGGGDLSVTIAPDTGWGALTGISGTLSIEIKDGKHLYDLAYRLPADH